jgi:parallel beta-helix repeat protein
VTTSILAGGTPVVFQPSGRQGTVSCGGTVGFQAGENTVQFLGGLGCASLGGAAAVTIATPNVTVNLAGFKIVGAALPANIGNIGIYVAASGVTINGGGTGSGNGIESFDFGVLDWGAAPGLTIDTLRIFRARSIGIRTSSDGVALNSVLIDRSAAATNATSWLPGGLGIYASGNITITDAIVRRSSTLGIWIAGDATHVGANGRVATITGSNSRVEANLDRGIWVDNGPHTIKDVHVTGDGIGGASTWGVVINSTGTQVELDGVIVQSYAGWGVVDAGISSKISRSSVDNTVANGFALNGTGANVSGNTAQATGYGFAVNGSGSVLTSNTAQFTQNGFAISGTGHQFSSNQSKQNAGIGFWVGGTSNTFTSNNAELNAGAEWNIGPSNLDGGGNKANGSTFTFDATGLIVN